jgi:hypothetical protein
MGTVNTCSFHGSGVIWRGFDDESCLNQGLTYPRVHSELSGSPGEIPSELPTINTYRITVIGLFVSATNVPGPLPRVVGVRVGCQDNSGIVNRRFSYCATST